MNTKGQIISVLEKEEFEGELYIEESYRTLFQTKGWELTTNFSWRIVSIPIVHINMKRQYFMRNKRK
ncbi:MAG: hypothetical protein ACLU5J_02995 [Christensenellales bacterium]